MRASSPAAMAAALDRPMVVAGALDDDPRKVSADALGHAEKNKYGMDHPGYRRLDLPTCIAAVESLITPMNHRMNGMEPFGKEGRAGAASPVRAAYVSEDGWVERYWSRLWPHPRDDGTGRLRPSPAPTRTRLHPRVARAGIGDYSTALVRPQGAPSQRGGVVRDFFREDTECVQDGPELGDGLGRREGHGVEIVVQLGRSDQFLNAAAGVQAASAIAELFGQELEVGRDQVDSPDRLAQVGRLASCRLEPPRSLRTGSICARPASSRAAAEEKRSTPVFNASRVLASSVSSSLSATFRSEATAGWMSASLALMTRSIPWAALETFLPASATEARKSSSFSALLEILDSPLAASLIAWSVSPAFSNALVAASSALDGSGRHHRR